MMTKPITLCTAEGVEMTVAAPACYPPAGVALWGDLAFVLVDADRLVYHEAQVVRVPDAYLGDMRAAADIAEAVTL